jgi:hypothetical protein
MQLTKVQLRYVLLNQGLLAIAMNFVMNGLMA